MAEQANSSILRKSTSLAEGATPDCGSPMPQVLQKCGGASRDRGEFDYSSLEKWKEKPSPFLIVPYTVSHPGTRILHCPHTIRDRKQIGHSECDLIQLRKKFGKASLRLSNE